jgi:hypothetical protein
MRRLRVCWLPPPAFLLSAQVSKHRQYQKFVEFFLQNFLFIIGLLKNFGVQEVVFILALLKFVVQTAVFILVLLKVYCVEVEFIFVLLKVCFADSYVYYCVAKTLLCLHFCLSLYWQGGRNGGFSSCSTYWGLPDANFDSVSGDYEFVY